MPPNADINPPTEPWALFREWYVLAEKSEPNDPGAMSLATVGGHGMPAVRIVLLKGYNEQGLVFYTNRESTKANQLARHPKTAICLHWKSIRRSIRAEGTVVPISDAESDAYFASRPRGAQIGAWASDQSRVLKDRAELENRVKEFEKKYENVTVPRPPHWGGYRLVPLSLEFWQDREFRLHDRILYHRADEKAPWIQERLYP